MKGIIIFEDSNPTLKNVYCINLTNSDIRMDLCTEATYTLTGIRSNMKRATCDESDTYDFETGALISLMKLCGVEKVKKAAKETFFDVAENSVNEYEEEIKKLREEIVELDYRKTCNETTIELLYNTINALSGIDDKYKKLKEENEKLEEEIKTLKEKFDKKVSDLRDQIHENSRLIQMNGELRDDVKNLEEEKNHLEDKYERCQHILDARVKDNYRLKEENEKLKLDCEKLQHGYNDMMFCGGRGNGKQHKALVELFKKIPKEKVQSAYVVAYKESLIWCTSQPTIRDHLDSLLESSKYAIPYTTEWINPPTKREEMWNEIFAIHKEKRPIIVVKKEDVNTFLHEIEDKNPKITWASGVKIFEAKGTIKDIYIELKRCDTIYFRLQKSNKLSYSTDPYIYPYYDFEHIPYLPPMRWDLFKKGRIVVGVKNNYELEDFRKDVEIVTGIKDIPTCPTNLCLFYSFDKDNYKIILETIEKPNIAKINGHKVYYWEDVR